MEYKGYKLEREPNFLMVEVRAIGRGSVHLSLRGYYQTYKDAMKAIDRYSSRLKRKEVENGRSTAASRA